MNCRHRGLFVALVAVAACAHGSPAAAIFPPRAPAGDSAPRRSATHAAPPAGKTIFQPQVHRYVVVAPVPPPTHQPIPADDPLPGELPLRFSQDVGLMWFASPPALPSFGHDHHALPSLPGEPQWHMQHLEAPSYPYGWFGAHTHPMRSGHVLYYGHTRESILSISP